MAISNASVTRAKCDACPQVVYAEGGAQPKGITGNAQEVDGNGRAVAASFFACQPNHVGAAVKNVLKGAKAVPASFAPLAPVASPEPMPWGSTAEGVQAEADAGDEYAS